MSGVAWVLAALLLAMAAAVAAWPAGAVLRRLHGRRRTSLQIVDLRRLWSRIRALADGSPRRAVGLGILTGAAVGTIVGGPIAGLVLAMYGALGARAAVRRAARRRAVAARSRSLDHLNALAADLRAGLAIGPLPALPGSATTLRGGTGTTVDLPDEARGGAGANQEFPDFDSRLAQLTAAVWRLAEQTGAPAADLVERIEADARASDRARATAAAQAAGAQATAVLLAALPLGGIALGYGIGVDPLEVLLRTPLGAACAVGAVLLQCGGLLWADRLATGPAR
jgi:tight adherence protein B